MILGERLDGHLVQGHVDTVAECISTDYFNGSWKYAFKYQKHHDYLTVEKGSVCVNGVSLTVTESGDDFFSVIIIPYTHTNTNFKFMKKSDMVNVEFDMIGKYVAQCIRG